VITHWQQPTVPGAESGALASCLSFFRFLPFFGDPIWATGKFSHPPTEGTLPCTASVDNENHYLTYEAVVARSLKAELSTVACSGKCIYSNHNGGW